jgi:hypothetical protein
VIFERTGCHELVRLILTHPSLYPHMTDDFAGPPEEFRVNTHPDIWYVLVKSREGGVPQGLFCLFPENGICWAAHVALYRGIPPAMTRQIGREWMAWLWANTPCRRLIASIPVCNRAAMKYAADPEGTHLLPFGVNEKSFLKRGRLWDQVLMGRSKPGE